MKKFFTLATLLLAGLTASAKTVEDGYVDFSSVTSIPWASDEAAARISFADGCFVYSSEEATANNWDAQYWIMGSMAFSPSYTYTVTMMIKGSVPGVMGNLKLGNWSMGKDNYEAFSFTDEWAEQSIQVSEVDGGDGIMLQTGAFVGEFQIKWIKVTHEEKEQTTEWINVLENGDASGEYGEVPCAVSKIYSGVGTASNDITPCEIVNDNGTKAFIVRAAAVNPNDWAEESDKNAYMWANQFWIQSPQAFPTGEIIKISFDYKASKATSAPTQAHGAPGAYHHWELLGSVAFTTDWQHFSKTVTLTADQAKAEGMSSIAFNLNDQITEAVDFYFTNMKWEVMKLEEGWFVCGDFNDFDTDSSVALTEEAGDEYVSYTGTVGTADKPASVVRISTKRGNDSAFDANGIKLSDGAVTPNEYQEYVAGYQKIELPAAGVWQITVVPEYSMIVFTDSEYDAIESVEKGNDHVIYYNLQGVRIDAPAHGLFLKKMGNKTVKVVK